MGNTNAETGGKPADREHNGLAEILALTGAEKAELLRIWRERVTSIRAAP
jgi:hypothetical protein